MRVHTILLLIIALVGLTGANDDVAAVSPSSGSATVPAKNDHSITATDAITIPRMLSYQGRLTDSLGNPVPDGNYQLTFRLYQQETGGSPFWSETQTATVRNGLFSALLGAVTPINSIPDAGVVWLSLQVGISPELTPRLRIVSSAFSFLSERSASADLLQGRDTTYFARATHTHAYVDSAGGAQRVGGYNITGLDNRYVNENQANAITSTMIVDGTIVRADVAGNFKAPYSDTADYARVAPATDSARVAGNSHRLQTRDTTYFAKATHTHAYVDSAGGAQRVGGYNITGLDNRYVNENQANAITSTMIVDGTIVRADVAGNFKAPYSDTADYARVAPATDSARVAGNSHLLQGKDTTGFVRTNQANAISTGMIQDNAVTGAKILDGTVTSVDIRDTTITTAKIKDNSITSAKIQDGQVQTPDIADTNVTMAKIQRAGATTGQVLKWTGSAWAPGNDSVGQGDNAWVRGTPDSVLYTIRMLGIARGGADNMLYGNYRYTHTNLGVACTTGTSGQDNSYCAVGGGYMNIASKNFTTVSGGRRNVALGLYATVGGGYEDIASGYATTVTGGYQNTASGSFATVGGGYADTASGYAATVGGGYKNTALANYATVGGGNTNTASSYYATVAGGAGNTASGHYATVPGGIFNTARGYASFAAGSYARANHRGSFVWSDSATSPAESVYTTGNDQFRVRARGGTWFFSNAGMTTGVVLASGSNSWASVCDSTNKTDFAPVDKKEILRRLAELRVRYYRMKDQNDGTRHLGPVAQDFKNAFGIGESDKAINMADADGVLFAAIQALYEENQELRQEIEALKTQIQLKR